MDYHKKYLEYKTKYHLLKKQVQIGGMKQEIYIMYLSKYIVPFKGIITLSDEPYKWIFNSDDSSISNEDNTFRWDTDGEPNLYKPLLLWRFKNNINQTSFTVNPNGVLLARGNPLTIKNNNVVFGAVTDINIKIIKLNEAFPASDPIKFVSYNILTGLSYYEDDFTRNINKELCTWGLGREKLVKKEVLKSDITVLVECTKEQLAYILDGHDKFEAHIELKIGETDGTVILFNKSRFILLKKRAVPLTVYGSQIVFNVILLDLQTHKLLCITGLHLKSGDAYDAERRRLVEIKSALKITNEFISEYSNIAQVICGDLNSDLYRYSVNGVESVLKENEYTNVGEGNMKPTYYYWQRSIYDYIFIKGPIKANSYDVDDVDKICPNNLQGSDHLAVRCNLIL